MCNLARSGQRRRSHWAGALARSAPDLTARRAQASAPKFHKDQGSGEGSENAPLTTRSPSSRFRQSCSKLPRMLLGSASEQAFARHERSCNSQDGGINPEAIPREGRKAASFHLCLYFDSLGKTAQYASHIEPPSPREHPARRSTRLRSGRRFPAGPVRARLRQMP